MVEARTTGKHESSRGRKQAGVERNQIHEGVPAITVILDGGWSKRSHKHSYNAKSGIGGYHRASYPEAAIHRSEKQGLHSMH